MPTIWEYVIRTALPTEPMVQYAIGRRTYNNRDPRLFVVLQQGFRTMRAAYAKLPGLKTADQDQGLNNLFDAKMATLDAGAIQLQSVAKAEGVPAPFRLPFEEETSSVLTVGEWVSGRKVAYGEQVMAYAGISPDDRFLDRWTELALALEEWPKQQWPHPHITTLTVETAGEERSPVEHEEAISVLVLADQIRLANTMREMKGLIRLIDSGHLERCGSPERRQKAERYLAQ